MINNPSLNTVNPHPIKKQQESNFLSRFSVLQKLLLFSLILVIPLLISLGIIAANFTKKASDSNLQALVVSKYPYVVDLQENVTYIDIDDSKTILGKFRSYLDSIEKAGNDLPSNLADLNNPQINSAAQDLSNSIKKYVAAVKANRPTQELNQYTNDIETKKLPQLYDLLYSTGNLSLVNNARLETYAYFTTKEIPNFINDFNRIYSPAYVIAKAALAKTDKKIGEKDLGQLNIATTESRAQLNKFQERYKNVTEGYPAVQTALSSSFQKAYDITATTLDETDKNIKGNVISGSYDKIYKDSDSYFLAQYGLFKDAANSLITEFNQQRDIARQQLWLLLGLLALLTLALFFILRNFARAFTLPIERLTQVARELSQGNYHVRVPVTSSDEIGVLSQSFNTAAVQLEENQQKNLQERQEAEQLQNNIGHFLDVTMDIAEGDLTKRGKVTEDVLGNVVDSINLMTEELSTVLKDVQSASSSVNGGSRAMLSTTEQINQGTQLTASEAQRVTQQMQTLAAAIRNMAQNAQTSAETARQALQASQQGQQAVSSTLNGMQSIRMASQNVAAQIQGLSTRSEQIQEIVDSISHIASQTNLLALHASIEAAGAGESGQRFTVVAQEVSQLADLAAQESQRITSLVRTVQNEIQGALQTVSESNREVEQGYRVAGSAGERLREIGALSERSAQLAEQISDATQEQVRGIEQMSQAVAQINIIAQQSAHSVEEGRAAAEQLQQLAGQLSSTLTRFKLPG